MTSCLSRAGVCALLVTLPYSCGVVGAGGRATVAPLTDEETRPAVAAPAPSPAAGPAVPAQPLTLEDAIALALERNPDVRAAVERIGEAEARVGEATAALYPQVSTRLGYTRTDNPAQVFAMVLAQRRFTFDADFNDPGATQDVRPEIAGALSLFRGGQDYQRRAAAMDRAEAARLERAAVRNALTDTVIAAYYALVAAPEQVEVTRASIDAVSSALDQTRARFDAGAALKSDVLSLEVRLAAAREANLRTQNGVELARTGLRLLLALPSEAPVDVVPPAAQEEPGLPRTFAEALEKARAERPEIEAAASVVRMREHELNSERGAYLPRIDAVAVYGADSDSFDFSGQDNWTVGATASLDLFSGFQVAERVRAAERRLAAAREGERKAQLEVERDVKAAFLGFEEARERGRVTEAAVGAAAEALRLVEVQYQGGSATITRYLEAEVARSEASSRAIAARYDALRARAALRRAMGDWAEGSQP